MRGTIGFLMLCFSGAFALLAQNPTTLHTATAWLFSGLFLGGALAVFIMIFVDHWEGP